MRVLAIAMVVMLHVAAPVRDQLENMATANWLAGAFLDALARCGVPLFVMISGALLLPKEEEIGAFYRKRVSKILIPFLFWAYFYALYTNWHTLKEFNPIDAIWDVFAGPTFYQMWFMYMIVGLYLVTPFLRIMVQHMTKKHLEWFLGLFFLFFVAIPHLSRELSTWFEIDLRFGFGIPVLDVYVGYFVLGHYLDRYGKISWGTGRLWMAFFGSTIVLVLGSYAVYRKSGGYNPMFVLNESPLVLLQAYILFLLFKQRKLRSEKENWLFPKIALLSFGIYLVHPLIIDVFERRYLGFQLNARTTETIMAIPLTFLVCFSLSFVVCWLLYQLPYIRKIVA